LEISYIICDQRLPNGVVVPDANHDWSTLNIEEIVMGQLVIARLTDKGSDQIYSKVLSLQRKQGVAYICGQVIGVEMRSGSVLILHNDVNKAQLVSTWFPASALKQVQIYSPPPANSYPPQEVTGEFLNSLKLQNSLKSLALLMQMTHGKA
jgi:other hect domain ubiquitin protein ligase E3